MGPRAPCEWHEWRTHTPWSAALSLLWGAAVLHLHGPSRHTLRRGGSFGLRPLVLPGLLAGLPRQLCQVRHCGSHLSSLPLHDCLVTGVPGLPCGEPSLILPACSVPSRGGRRRHWILGGEGPFLPLTAVRAAPPGHDLSSPRRLPVPVWHCSLWGLRRGGTLRHPLRKIHIVSEERSRTGPGTGIPRVDLRQHQALPTLREPNSEERWLPAYAVPAMQLLLLLGVRRRRAPLQQFPVQERWF
mmetsp:Transcript_12981/g.37772  ORF Transcript_12981/g.37772 Transcript_12981/m.37772 type:complete len:243 (-) Transcript_12981:1017-1745(-)